MDDVKYPEWQETYKEALLECDPQRLIELVAKAEKAIFLRLQALQTSSNGHVERQAIEDALNGLRVLRRENLTPHV